MGGWFSSRASEFIGGSVVEILTARKLFCNYMSFQRLIPPFTILYDTIAFELTCGGMSHLDQGLLSFSK